MHTVMVVLAGFFLLGFGLIVAYSLSGRAAGFRIVCWAFIPLWLVGALVNMWAGVNRAGYTVRQELPFFLVVFSIPTLVAVVILLVTKKFSPKT